MQWSNIKSETGDMRRLDAFLHFFPNSYLCTVSGKGRDFKWFSGVPKTKGRLLPWLTWPLIHTHPEATTRPQHPHWNLLARPVQDPSTASSRTLTWSGYYSTNWNHLMWVIVLLISHTDRLYSLTQTTWKHVITLNHRMKFVRAFPWCWKSLNTSVTKKVVLGALHHINLLSVTKHEFPCTSVMIMSAIILFKSTFLQSRVQTLWLVSVTLLWTSGFCQKLRQEQPLVLLTKQMSAALTRCGLQRLWHDILSWNMPWYGVKRPFKRNAYPSGLKM